LSLPQKECQKKSHKSPSSVPKQEKIVSKKKVHIPSHPLFPAVIPSSTISPPVLGSLWITENKGRNPDRGWDRVWDWGGLYR